MENAKYNVAANAANDYGDDKMQRRLLAAADRSRRKLSLSIALNTAPAAAAPVNHRRSPAPVSLTVTRLSWLDTTVRLKGGGRGRRGHGAGAKNAKRVMLGAGSGVPTS